MRAILSPEPNSACTRYCNKSRASINRMPGKTAAMALLTSPPLHPGVGCPSVTTHKILGILLDSDLSFMPLLRRTLAVGWTCFLQVYHAADAGGFTVPIIASQVSLRIDAKTLYASAFLILAPRAATLLNNLQYRWARTILGCRRARNLKWLLPVASCGWTIRLGTRMLEIAVIAYARIALLPVGHPAVSLLQLALNLPCISWAGVVRSSMHADRLAHSIPDITEVMAASDVDAARKDADHRRALLKQYKWDFVRPILAAADEYDYQKAAQKVIAPFQLPFADFVPSLQKFELDFISAPGGPLMRVWFRSWALVRMFGCWPLTLYGSDDLPAFIPECKACGECNVDVIHPLCTCCGTQCLFNTQFSILSQQDRRATKEFFTWLFGPGPSSAERYLQIEYVAKAIGLSAFGTRVHTESATGNTESNDIDFILKLAAARAKEQDEAFIPDQVEEDAD